MNDLGAPIAYLVLRTGTPVYDRDGERVGVVEHVLADEAVDIFHGLVVHTEPLPGRDVYADADQIAALRERGVLLSAGRGEPPSRSPRRSRATRRVRWRAPCTRACAGRATGSAATRPIPRGDADPPGSPVARCPWATGRLLPALATAGGRI